MRARLLAILIILTAVAGCSRKVVEIRDDKYLTSRLIKRIEDFEFSLIDNDKEKAWELRSNYFKNIFVKYDYFSYLDSGDFLTNYNKGYHTVRYYIENISVNDDKARITLKYSSQETSDSKKEEYLTYNYWVYEKGDWYLSERGFASSKVNWY